MAAPTVHYFEAPAGTGSSLLSVWMPKLQELLLDAGWTLEYADSDAIGGSVDPSTPAWDKTPAENTDAGVAVYRMPANDHDTRWYVRLRPGWAAATNRAHMRGVTLGTTHDGSGGISGAGSELAPSVALASTGNRQVLIASSEDGFALHLPNATSGTAMTVIVERARRSDTGAITDDVLALNTFSSAVSVLARAGVGVVHNHLPVVLGGFTNAAAPVAFGSAVSLENHDASDIPIVGPYWLRGHPFFHGRLAFLVSTGDHNNNSDRDLHIDGSARTYRVAALNQGDNWAVWAVATE